MPRKMMADHLPKVPARPRRPEAALKRIASATRDLHRGLLLFSPGSSGPKPRSRPSSPTTPRGGGRPAAPARGRPRRDRSAPLLRPRSLHRVPQPRHPGRQQVPVAPFAPGHHRLRGQLPAHRYRRCRADRPRDCAADQSDHCDARPAGTAAAEGGARTCQIRNGCRSKTEVGRRLPKARNGPNRKPIRRACLPCRAIRKISKRVDALEADEHRQEGVLAKAEADHQRHLRRPGPCRPGTPPRRCPERACAADPARRNSSQRSGCAAADST